MRLFVAVAFPDEFLESIDERLKLLKIDFPEVAWTKGENIHLTLKFLGETKMGIGKIKNKIENSTNLSGSFLLRVAKLGYFDRGQLIIWQGFGVNKELLKLIDSLDKELGKLGFKKERKEYTPHMTLGRGKRLSPQKKKEIIDRLSNFNLRSVGEMAISEIGLIKSQLTPKGPIYDKLFSFSLRKEV